MPSYDRRDWLRIICLVSTRWKKIAYSLPVLWCVIEVQYQVFWRRDGTEHEPSYQACRMHLALAKSHPLDIYLNVNLTKISSTRHQGFWRIWEEVTQRSDQWRSIRIGRIPIPPAEHANLPRLLPPCLPNLLEARFQVATGPLMSYVSAPRLRVLYGTYPSETPFIPFISIDSLEILWITHFCRHVQNLLQHAPRLQILHVNHHPENAPIAMDWTASLPALRRIEARLSPASLSRLLSCIAALRLEVISITIPNVRYTPNNIHDLHFPALTTIEFQPRSAFCFEPLRHLLAMFRQTASFTIKISRPRSHEPPVVRSAADAEEEMRWVEERVARVVWMGGEHERGLSSELWTQTLTHTYQSHPIVGTNITNS